ncbi:hypothetical protein BOX15_Mlig012075g14 [Macrostomum lignano]|uniref:DUF4218 domain-containing protein n=1 Tax=Macrostomum lignano TaxID=282301 RepID=A0A267GCM7_9PLAT|nr:hypothetical protein BOX15_Mlig012075g14 [Macrostomum lignano]
MASRQTANRYIREYLLTLMSADSTANCVEDESLSEVSASFQLSEAEEFANPHVWKDLAPDAGEDNSEIPYCYSHESSGESSDTSDDESGSATSNPQTSRPSLPAKLLTFMLIFSVSKRAMQHLLVILNEEGCNVPKSVSTLKRYCQPISHDLLSVACGGQFAYFGIMNNIRFCFERQLLKLNDHFQKLTILVNFDGVPVYKSSKMCLWPILLAIKGVDLSVPLPIGVFCGINRPPLSTYLESFAQELRSLMETYVSIANKAIKIERCIIIADAPARAFIQGIYSHSARLACGYCKIEGSRIENRMCFPYNQYEPRTNDAYMSMRESNQLVSSPLLGIVNFVEDLPPEYMHSVCLGVVKRLFSLYVYSIKGIKLPCRLSAVQRIHLSQLMIQVSKCLPREFHRKLRSLDEFEHFKACEFRTLIVYLAPVLFRKFLPAPYFDHLMLLHVAIFCFVSQELSTSLFHQASSCITLFCQRAPGLYKGALQSFNAHLLSHMPHFVESLGPLDQWSAFFSKTTTEF